MLRSIGGAETTFCAASQNQPALRENIADLFGNPTPDRRRGSEIEPWDKAYGRLERRHLLCSPDLNGWFGKQWERIEQVFRLERTARILKTNQLREASRLWARVVSRCGARPQCGCSR